MRIKSAKARVVLNSRGEPTIEVEINGYSESVPAGASKGKYEAKYLDPVKAVELFNKELVDFLKTYDIQTFNDLRNFEEDFYNIGGIEKYGANTLLAIEYSILRAWSHYYNWPIYMFFNKKPKVNIKILANVVGGGAHSKGKGLSIQEFLISPDTDNLKLSIFLSSAIHQDLGKKLELLDLNFLYGRNDEGAWVTSLEENTIFIILRDIIKEYEEKYQVKINLGIDMAASQLYKDGKYVYKNKVLGRGEQINYVLNLIDTFNIFYVEDPLEEDDFEGFSLINEKTNSLIVGDDLTVTNLDRIKKAISYKSVKGVIIKPNQIGSIGKTYDAIELCKKHGLIPIMSHRSGETESNILAHLAVGMEVSYVKFGINGGERIAKLNELIRIYEKLNEV